MGCVKLGEKIAFSCLLWLIKPQINYLISRNPWEVIISGPVYVPPSNLSVTLTHLVQLVVDVPDAGEARLSVVHLDEDAADAPDVERGVVVGRAEEDVGRAVPQGHNLVRVRVRRHRFRTGQA